MKKNKLVGLVAVFLSLGMVACGGGNDTAWESDKTNHWTLTADGEIDEASKAKHEFVEDTSKGKAATCSEKGSKVEVCSVCGYEKTTEIKQLSHDYKEDASQSKAATCAEAGEKVEVCSVCKDVKKTPINKLSHNYVAKEDATHKNVTATCSVEGSHWEQCTLCNGWQEVKEGYADHAWGEYGADVVVANNTTFKKRTCRSCGAVDVMFSALDWTNIEGSNKDTTNATLKLSKNGNYTEYKFNLGGAFTGKVAIYGWVDRIGGNDNNITKDFFTGKNDASKGNFAISVNGGDPIEITNKKSYQDMGMEPSGVMVADNGTTSGSTYERSTPVLCDVGAITIAAGEATLKYARVDSYNLNISEIHLIGTIAK